MNLRFSQLHTNKMANYMFKEYKPCSIPQFSKPTTEEPTPKLIGFIKAKKIVASHPIDKVFFDDSGNVVVLQFKDKYDNQCLSSSEYNRIWREVNSKINKEYDRRFGGRKHPIMSSIGTNLDIKGQREDGIL